MSIFVLGINHKTASVQLREQIYFAPEKLTLYLQDLLSQGYTEEAVLLSTCNRSELYFEAETEEAVTDWFCKQATVTRPELEQALYCYRDAAAVSHIMHVACGLDSMVLGEPQILGQLKEAFSESVSAGMVGSVFHQLFKHVFSIAKEIRTTTAIGACPVSVASAAVYFAKQQLPHFSSARILLVGAGDTTELILRYLRMQCPGPVHVLNRSVEKASALVADESGGLVFGLDQVTEALQQADLVFSATGSVVPVITKAMVAEVKRDATLPPLTFIDVAVPRDIDPAVSELEQVQLYCIDDLKIIIEQHKRGREHAADKAKDMIHERSQAFIFELQSQDKVAHTIRAYRGQVEAICGAELLKAKHQLQLGVDPEQVMEAFAYAFTKKLLHTPSVQLRQAGAEGRFELLRVAKQLFAIPDSEIECI